MSASPVLAEKLNQRHRKDRTPVILICLTPPGPYRVQDQADKQHRYSHIERPGQRQRPENAGEFTGSKYIKSQQVKIGGLAADSVKKTFIGLSSYLIQVTLFIYIV